MEAQLSVGMHINAVAICNLKNHMLVGMTWGVCVCIFSHGE